MGTNRRIAVLELNDDRAEAPNDCDSIVFARWGSSPQSGYHACEVMQMIRFPSLAPYGAAPAAEILLVPTTVSSGPAFSAYGGDYYSWALDLKADVFSRSNVNILQYCNASTLSVHPEDWVALRFPYSMSVSGAGNSGSSVTGCHYVANRGYNGVVVGGSNDQSTATRSDDTAWLEPPTIPIPGDIDGRGTSWGNPASAHNDRELPEIVAPARNVSIKYSNGSIQGIGGTSLSTPMVASAVALLRQRNPFNLATGNWPEAQKAILMASVDCDVHQGFLSFTDAIDDRDGVGELHVMRALSLGDPQNNTTAYGQPATRGFRYGSMYFPSSFPSGEWQVTPQIKSGEGGFLRIVLAWDATPVCSGAPPSIQCTENAPDADLNIALVRSNGSVVASSTSFDNNYEVITVQVPAGETYNLVVTQAGTARTSMTYYGLAWDMFSANCAGP